MNELNRKTFMKLAAAGGTLSVVASSRAEDTTPAFAKGAVELEPILKSATIRANPALTGKGASLFIDDAIWFLRDLARQRPKSLFDNAFLKPLKEAHDRFGLKLQINLFYRTDFFYGMDEFTLAEVPADYKAEWQASKDWLKLGFHSLQ